MRRLVKVRRQPLWLPPSDSPTVDMLNWLLSGLGKERSERAVTDPRSLSFPSSFHLKDLSAITAPVFALKRSVHQDAADKAARVWFENVGVYNNRRLDRFLRVGKFDLFAALSFPNADARHLETCLAFFLWAFSTDDLSDEGEFQNSPRDVQAGHDISMRVLHDKDAPRPTYPYAAMLYDILHSIRTTSSQGVYERFCRAFEAWSSSQVTQSNNRKEHLFPSVEEFILMRRATIGGAMVEAMVEYSLDLDIPAHVFEDPIVQGMSDAANDAMTWPNDLCSFNKEQADGDYQNLVCIIMVERGVDLQAAVNILTDMLAERVRDYANLKQKLPSFGAEIDARLAVYYENLEHFVQGTVVWYYNSPRYFPPDGITDPRDLQVELLMRGRMDTPQGGISLSKGSSDITSMIVQLGSSMYHRLF
ncbi:terpenoid synthase [Peniophora sp. CONT]|nr:terpenoid synthase [Peniophora sp. CONT]